MGVNESLQLFQEKKIRTAWDDQQEKWYFSIIDVVGVLTDSAEPKRYWSDLKRKLLKEGAYETYEKIVRLKLVSSDGKKRLTDVADQEQLFRIIQSIPSPKAEPFKLWMAQVASQRIDQLQDPELSINQAIADYRRLGYSEDWINQRIKSIEVRKLLTDEWKRTGVEEGVQYATLTNIITQAWSGLTTNEYKQYKGLKKQNLRDNMTNTELILNMLAETATTDISKNEDPQSFEENKRVARKGGNVAKAARVQLEETLGHSVISSRKASDYIIPTTENKAIE